MDRLTPTRYLFGLALVLMPASYTMKYFLGALDITWVNPTLVLGAVAFLLVGYRARDGWTLALTAYAFIAALIGSFYLVPSLEREKAPLYVIYSEPVRLALNVAWFWVCLHYWKKHRDFTLRWLAISAILQFAVAVYLYLAMLELLPVPQLVQLYLDIYKTRQIVWFGDVPVYRMAGTFFESPPFGLFMICCFVVLALEWIAPSETHDPRLQLWIKTGAAVSLIATIASLSDQILVAFFVLGVAFLLHRMKQSKRNQALVWAGIAFAAALYIGAQAIAKWQSAQSVGQDIYGQSMGERLYHLGYSLRVLSDEPAGIVTGVGPGRYGDYVARTGMFEPTVVPGITLVEWMVDFGVVGLFLFGGWLWGVTQMARRRFGPLGTAAVATLLMANMFQMGWKWESWFFALAALSAAAAEFRPLATVGAAPRQN
jgi:arginine exporter protein ArgO